MIVKMAPHLKHSDQIWLVYFEHKGASANIAWLADRRDTAYLYDVFSKNKRQGEASELLQEINQYCLENQVTLIIRAEIFDQGQDGIQTNEELKAWYEKNGAFFMEYNEKGAPILLMGDHHNWKKI